MFFYEDYKKLLEYIAKAKPIKFILNEIIKSVEKQDKNIICSIFLLDETEERLKNAKAVKLDLGKFKLDYSNSERVSGIIDDKKDVMIWYEYKNERAIKGYRINNKEVNCK